jgi:myo-inositol-1(or 4)-monophosphatase
MARFEAGVPVLAILEVPPLRQRIVAIRGQGAWRNGKPIPPPAEQVHNAGCASLCSRSIRVLQKLPQRPFPGKIRLLGVASLNLVSVAMGQTMAALEATPKIWDLAAAWLVQVGVHGCVPAAPCGGSATADAGGTRGRAAHSIGRIAGPVLESC